LTQSITLLSCCFKTVTGSLWSLTESRTTQLVTCHIGTVPHTVIEGRLGSKVPGGTELQVSSEKVTIRFGAQAVFEAENSVW